MLREYPGLDVLDFHRGLMTPRRLAVLINGLPPTSATRYAMEHPDDPDDRRWDDATYLLNHIANVDQQHLRVSWTGHGLKGRQPKFSPLLPPEERAAHEREQAERLAKSRENVTYLEQYRGNARRARPMPGRSITRQELEAAGAGARQPTPPSPELEAAMRQAAERRGRR